MKNFTRFISAFFVALALLCIGCSEDTTADVDKPVDDDDIVITEGSFSVTFESNGGTLVDSQTIDAYDSAIEPEAPILTGYVLDGWCTDEALTKDYNFIIPITADLKLYAKWSLAIYDVTFYYCDGSETTYETSVEFGGSVVAPNNPSLFNHTFEGWHTAETGGDEYAFEAIDASTIPADGTISIYAQWREIPTVATVYFYSAISYDGTETAFDTQYLQPGVAIPTITAEPIDHCTTDGKWYTDVECTVEYDTSKTYQEEAEMIEVKLYAKWIVDTYPVTFSTDFGTAPENIAAVAHGSVIESLGAKPEQAGYTFDGWYSDRKYTTVFEEGVTEVTGATTLYAKWTPITYNVIFHYENGAEVDTYETTVEFATIIEAMESEPTNGEYSLMGWYTGKKGVGVQYTFEELSEEFIPEDGLTIDLYAYWANAVGVKFYSAVEYDGSELLIATQYLLEGETATAITPISITGYTFSGKWYSDTACTQEYDFTATYTDGADDVSIYAKWDINTYTVSFSTEHGVAPSPITVNHGDILDGKFTVPEADGYDLVGWYTNEKLTFDFDITSDKVTSDITLYAEWQKGDIYVTFVYNNNGATADKEVAYSYSDGYGTANQIIDPSGYDDHTFIGWYADEAMTTVYDFDTELTGSIKIYAKWWDHNATDVDIWTLDELVLFRDLTNKQIALKTNVTLKADIDLSSVCSEDLGVSWTSIADYNATATVAEYAYSGKFDGGNHTISNLYVSATTHGHAFFGVIGDGATIENLHMKDINISRANTSTLNLYASVASYVKNLAYVTNCTTTDGIISGSNQCGGIVAGSFGGQLIMTNCHNYGTAVTVGTNFAGGLVGRLSSVDAASASSVTNCSNSGIVTGTYAGGIAAEASFGTVIIGCSNSGTIAKNAVYQGGIVGVTQFWTAGTITITACYNTGAISATSASNVGGILGGVYTKAGSTASITSCYNMGAISTSGTSGGIIGNTNGTTTLAENYFIGSPTHGVGGTNVSGASKLADVTALSAVLSTMNAACSSSGYKFVEGTDHPIIEIIEAL